MVNFPSTTVGRKFRVEKLENLARCEVASFPSPLYLSTVRGGGSRSCDQNLSNERRNQKFPSQGDRGIAAIVNRPPLKRFEDFVGRGERRRVRGRQLNNGG